MGGSCQRTWQHAVPKRAHADPRGGWDVLISDGFIQLEFYSDDMTRMVASSQAPPVIRANEWHHVVFAYDGARQCSAARPAST